MTPRIPPRDLEQLSAYLDESLPARAKTQLEARLSVEPNLTAALQQLRWLRAMLRRAPQRRLPRSFVLQPQMRNRPAASRWNSFNFASAVASLMLVLTLIGDFSVNGLPVFAKASSQEPMALMAEAPAAEDAAGMIAPTTDPPAIESGEVEPYAAETSRMADNDPVVDFIAQNSRPLEAVLASVALLSGLAALHLRRRAR